MIRVRGQPAHGCEGLWYVFVTCFPVSFGIVSTHRQRMLAPVIQRASSEARSATNVRHVFLPCRCSSVLHPSTIPRPASVS